MRRYGAATPELWWAMLGVRLVWGLAVVFFVPTKQGRVVGDLPRDCNENEITRLSTLLAWGIRITGVRLS